MWCIVYSCLLTVFACIWTAVHPNVPGRYYSSWSLKWPRIELMALSLVSPEFILTIAWKEFLTSWRISKKCKKVEEWTLTHSYFVTMNGFYDLPKGRTVDLNDLQQYPGIIEKFGDVRKAAITKEKILDRSKRDPFAKLIIVIQFLWFITQYTGRWAGRLHRSQLETMTLAYVALNVIVYVLWWHKPVNVQFPIHVTEEFPPTSETNQQALKVETGADPTTPVKEVGTPGLAFIFAATGIIFGGIHCFAWSFPFPTYVEMILWRISAIYITAAPVVLALSVWVAGHAAVDHVSDVGAGVVLLSGPVYAIARVILLVLTFTSLRSPPPDLYQTPSWSLLLPHFG
ncbi:uncharacterized protein EI90DRAFT_3093419 [Cantharellus anzutake]|nr:uncharacterized protein EI90DRAFT_3093419 [Cantharellus anzutake]KAF8312576.1 hypothetical protein EI90DRAFT_3093419 [Cantharellus anzutake]